VALPTHIAEAITENFGKGSVPKFGWYADGESTCEGAAFHSPTPLVLVNVWITPEPIGKADDASEYQATLCPTCAANLGVLQSLLVATEGELAWAVRREFGNTLRLLAMRGWDRYKKEGASG
jgi:hypothetical protein